MRYIFGECTLDTQRAELARAGCVSRLRRKVFQVLVYLLAQADRVVSKQELGAQVWPQQFISDTALESVIKAVRQAIGDSGRSQRLLQTVYGQGYRFVAPVEERAPLPADTVPQARQSPAPALHPLASQEASARASSGRLWRFSIARAARRTLQSG